MLGEKAGRGKTTTALDRRLVEKGASKDDIARVNALIQSLLKSAEVKQEDMGDKIELLKKVEITFHELSERRKVYALEKGKILKEKEDTLNGIRRTKRIDKKNAELEAREDEKRRLIKEKQMKRD